MLMKNQYDSFVEKYTVLHITFYSFASKIHHSALLLSFLFLILNKYKTQNKEWKRFHWHKKTDATGKVNEKSIRADSAIHAISVHWQRHSRHQHLQTTPIMLNLVVVCVIIAWASWVHCKVLVRSMQYGADSRIWVCFDSEIRPKYIKRLRKKMSKLR